MANASNLDIPITWFEACENACALNYKQIMQRHTVVHWYLQLHQAKDMKFKRSTKGKASTISKSPFTENEELTIRFKMWARSDIENLSVQKSHEFINTKLLNNWTTEQLANNLISFPVSLHVCSRWMKEAGFRYQRYKKTYYVDRHEDPDVVADRNSYVNTTLPLEVYEHCWIQQPKQEYLKTLFKQKTNEVNIKQTKGVKGEQEKNYEHSVEKYIAENQVHFFTNKEGREMVEQHVDDVYSYNNEEDKRKKLPDIGEYGGALSVRLPVGARPRIIFGQDEAIYRSSQLNDNCWCIDDESPLRSKGMDQGIMVSAFVSRAFGFGLEITKEKLDEINKKRSTTKYKDEDAATWLLGSPLKEKAPLVSSPFVRFLSHGAGTDGYWNCNHMVVQVQNTIDCLTNLYPQFDFEFELDHSSGHNK